MLMADHLILSSLQPPPSLIFPSYLHRRWRFSGGSRFSVPEFRLSSSQLQLANSTSPSSSSSAPEKFDLVFTTQLGDGSHVFRFGDESEIERYLEIEAKLKKQNTKLAEEEASEVLRKQEVKDGLTLVDQDGDSELESPKRKSASSSNVIKIKDRKRVRSPTKKKKEPSVSVNVSPSEDKVASVSNLSSIVSVAEAVPTSSTEENGVVSRESEPVNVNESTLESLSSQVMIDETKVASVSNLSSIVSVSEDVSTSSVEEKVVVSSESEPIDENVEPLSSEVIEKSSVNDIGNSETTNGCVEVQARPRSSYDLEEVAYVSTIELDDNLDARETPMITFEAQENLVDEPTATATVSPDELISASEATQQSVDKIAVIDTSEENLVVEPTATTIVSPDELISASEATQESVEKIDVIDTSEENLDIEPTATIIVSPDELIPASEETHHSVDKFAETPEVANEEENVVSTIEDEIAVSDTKTDNGSLSKTVSDTGSENLQSPVSETIDDTKSKDLQSPAPEAPSLESFEDVSDREELVSKPFYLESGFASLQNPFKALAGREDAYFISHNNWLGVADGVSHWSFEGIKKGMYAQELMSNCEKIISDEASKIADPVQVLCRSVDKTKSPGSSTALVARLDNNELHIANIGDSGFMVIRNRKVLQKSSPMFHHFCFPLQITQGDADVLKLVEVYHVNLEEDDVIITATDGLFDNLYEKEIVAMVCRLLEQSLEPQKIAELVAEKAQDVGRSKTERTPFADSAKEEGYVGYKGGKLDDVTVIVSIVKTVSI